MDLTAFKESVFSERPPAGVSEYIKALWYDAKGNWDKAHHLIQDIDDANASWIHAYLHRKEGDISNAGYWYKRAGKTKSNLTPDKEWEEIVLALL